MELKSKKKRFNKEFKDSAVQLVENGRSAAQVARELGLPEWQVQTWVRDARKKRSTTVGDVGLLEENKRLKKENARLQEEAEILKRLQRSSRETSSEIRMDPRASRNLPRSSHVQSPWRIAPGILPMG